MTSTNNPNIKKIQKNKWYIANPILGYQRKSYSDIEKCITNYNC